MRSIQLLRQHQSIRYLGKAVSVPRHRQQNKYKSDEIYSGALQVISFATNSPLQIVHDRESHNTNPGGVHLRGRGGWLIRWIPQLKSLADSKKKEKTMNSCMRKYQAAKNVQSRTHLD